jgi:hypothetical protein
VLMCHLRENGDVHRELQASGEAAQLGGGCRGPGTFLRSRPEQLAPHPAPHRPY